MISCCVIGLGYIGLPTAAILSDNGILVNGVDINQNVLSSLRKGETHIIEKNLDKLVHKSISNNLLKVSEKPNEADVFIITVPTPFKTKESEIPNPNLDYVYAAVASIAPVLKKGNLVILESTSPIGTTEAIADKLCEITKFDLNEFSLAYSPERVLPGNILNELISNDRIVGGINKESAIKAKKFYEKFCKGNIYITSSSTAEIVKLSENSFRDINIAFANELSMVCHKNNLNVMEVIKLANCHPRVEILNPGCGVGGHCIAVDPWFIASNSPELTPLIQSARKVNVDKAMWVVERVIEQYLLFKDKFNREPTVGIMGLAYKPNIDDLRESPAIFIASKLVDNGLKIVACEPNIKNYANLDVLPLNDIIKKSDILIFLVAHNQFKDIKIQPNQICLNYCDLVFN